MAHSDLANLTSFLRGELSSSENCDLVRALLVRSRDEPQAADAGTPAAPRPVSLDYSQAFTQGGQVSQETFQAWACERAELPSLIARLNSRPALERRSLVKSDPAFQIWPLCEDLIERSHRLVYLDMEEAILLADLGVTVAEELDPERYGLQRVTDLQARAWAAVGEVLRNLPDLASAEEAFARADALLEGSDDHLEEAAILELKAALWRDQRRKEESLRLLTEVAAMYRQCREPHMMGRAFIQTGQTLGDGHEFRAACDWLRKGLAQLDAGREVEFELSARYNLMLYLHEDGRQQEAWFMLKATQHEYLEHGGTLLNLRLRWLEGNIQRALGFLEEAEASFLEARRGLFEQRVGFDAASISIDLASLYASQGRLAEVRQIATEMVPMLQAPDLHREAVAALLLFQRSAEIEKVNHEMLRAIRFYLNQARKDHKLHFDFCT
ncbi:MAG: hypothetical protein M3O15_03830 [Acidobacteriota bacterium]|nr:hypothetical protein [Acidobacteriota bacterium]